MTYWQAYRSTFSAATAFLFACPLVAAVPMIAELIQHIVEAQIGMYDSVEAAQALELDPRRMGFGYVKMFALMLSVYWATRYAATRDARFAMRLDPAALRTFAGFLLFQIIFNGAMELLLPRDNVPLFLSGFLVMELIAAAIAAWGAAASLGNGQIGPLASLRIMGPKLPQTFLFFMAVMLPVMIPHYAFAALALLGPKAMLWPALLVDTVLVGWLAAVLPTSGYFAARIAADRAGVALSPEPLVQG